MDFVTETTDSYSAAEFYDAFEQSLPKVVMVNQGFCGEIVEDTFDRGQILRLHTVAKQRRVVAKSETTGTHRLFSIPASYHEKLCAMGKHGKLGKEQTLLSILHNHTLPVIVRFPKDRTITVGNQTLHTNNLPQLELTQDFEEVYFLANFITDGVLAQEITPVPLYLSQLRFVLVTGLQGQIKEKWYGYLEELERQCSHLKYNQEFGNPEVAVYHQESAHSDKTYSYVEPTEYINFARFFHKTGIDNMTYISDPTADDGDTYDVVSYPSNGSMAKTVDSFKPPQQSKAVSKELSTAIKTKIKPAIPEKTTTNPPVAPKPKKVVLTNPKESNSPKQQSKETSPDSYEAAPVVPARPAFIASKPDPSVTNPYSNHLPRVSVKPVSSGVKHQPEEHAGQQKQATENRRRSSGSSGGQRDSKDCSIVADLTIDEVGEYLIKLNLGQFVETFKENMIDGALLIELDKDLLKDDFGFKGIEALRLTKFASTGHVPT